MKVQRTEDRLVVYLGKRETHLLLEVLKLYPCIPPAHHQLSRVTQLPNSAETQRLLDEALAEQRAENKRLLQALLQDPGRTRRLETGWQLALSPGDAEWLLQILNDIRVGSWLLLGAPEDKLPVEPLNKATAPHFWAMELSGHFQMHLLQAMTEG